MVVLERHYGEGTAVVVISCDNLAIFVVGAMRQSIGGKLSRPQFELELQRIQARMGQKPVLWIHVAIALSKTPRIETRVGILFHYQTRKLAY